MGLWEKPYQIQYRVYWKDDHFGSGSLLIGADNGDEAIKKAKYRLNPGEEPFLAELAR